MYIIFYRHEMPEQEKSNLISLATTLLVSLPYFAFLYFRYQAETFSGSDSELSFWASAILLMIPLRIVAEILMYILVTVATGIVTGKEEKTIKDERDNMIELRANQNSYAIFIIGFMGAMLAVASTGSITTMFVIIIGSGFASELMGIVSKIAFYRKGLSI